MKYPNVQAVTSIDNALAANSDPNIFPTTTGIRLKNPPEPAPFRMAKRTTMPTEDETGHTTMMLVLLMTRESRRPLIGPKMLSAPRPIIIRPAADAMFHVARITAQIPFESPIELAYSGRRNGGTKSGKVATAPMTKRMQNFMFLKRCLE
jgi:hypothetical protein